MPFRLLPDNAAPLPFGLRRSCRAPCNNENRDPEESYHQHSAIPKTSARSLIRRPSNAKRARGVRGDASVNGARRGGASGAVQGRAVAGSGSIIFPTLRVTHFCKHQASKHPSTRAAGAARAPAGEAVGVPRPSRHRARRTLAGWAPRQSTYLLVADTSGNLLG